MRWEIELTDEAVGWYEALSTKDQRSIAAAIDLLAEHGPGLGRRTRPQHPFLRAPQHDGRVLTIQQDQSCPVEAAGDGVTHAVVHHEPALLRLEGRGTHPHAGGIPPTTPPAVQHPLRGSPAPEIRRARYPHVGALPRRRAVEEHPVSVDAARQQRSVLVVGCHDRPQALERPEVVGPGERDPRSRRPEGGVGDDPVAELVDVGDPRVLQAPLLLGPFTVVGQARTVVDDPVRHPIPRAGAREVREAATVLDAAEEHDLVVDACRACVHHRVDGIRPALRRQHRIAGIPGEQRRAVDHARDSVDTGWTARVWRFAASRASNAWR